MLNKANEIVLVDFGLSKHFVGEDDQIKATAGTMLYYAPEIVRTGVPDKVVRGRQADVWAAGVTLFQVATGKHPFPGETVFDYKDLVLDTEPDYSLVKSESAVQDALLIEFFKKMLTKDPERRATMQDLTTDKWLTRDMKNPMIIFDPIETLQSDYQTSCDSLEEVPEKDKKFEDDLPFPEELIGLQLQDLIGDVETFGYNKLRGRSRIISLDDNASIALSQ